MLQLCLQNTKLPSVQLRRLYDWQSSSINHFVNQLDKHKTRGKSKNKKKRLRRGGSRIFQDCLVLGLVLAMSPKWCNLKTGRKRKTVTLEILLPKDSPPFSFFVWNHQEDVASHSIHPPLPSEIDVDLQVLLCFSKLGGYLKVCSKIFSISLTK